MTTAASRVSEGESSIRRAAAERDTLLELLAAFTHDLSNPLQSITVLCELGMDGPDAQESAEQCLLAAERMRVLIHGLSGFTRGLQRESDVARVLERQDALLARRFDRHQLQTAFTGGEIANTVVPAHLEFALIALSLGIIATASETKAGGRLEIRGRADAATRELVVHGRSNGGDALHPDAIHLQRALAIADEAITIVQDGDQTIVRFSEGR